MTNLILLIACLVAGVLLRASDRLPNDAHVTLNGLIINLVLPAVVLVQVHGIRLTHGLIWPVMMPWLLFALSAGCFIGLGRALRVSTGTIGALVMTTGLANTSFVGLPMIEAFYGRQQLPTGILIDQLGTYLVLSTAGIALACLFSAQSRITWRGVALRMATFPPLVALLVALATAELAYPPWLTPVLHRVADLLAPLALVSVGLQLRLRGLAGYRRALVTGLAFKLVVAPLAFTLLYAGVLHRTDETTRVTIFEAAMGPQIAGSVIAMQNGLNPTLVTLMVGIGITLSFATLPAWWWGLHLL